MKEYKHTNPLKSVHLAHTLLFALHHVVSDLYIRKKQRLINIYSLTTDENKENCSVFQPVIHGESSGGIKRYFKL
jgi:hypothetical protein